MLNFSFALIMRNESKTLPRLITSLKEYQDRGGKIVVLDTGSTDGSPQIARDLGCEVHEVGERFLLTIDATTAKAINKKFVIGNEKPVIAAGDRQFDYSAARNFIAQHAHTDFIFTPDCDEIWTKFDIDKVQQVIASGVEQLEYNFVFSHDKYGNELIKFKHCKAYDRRKLHWRGIIHEVLSGTAKCEILGEEFLKLEHWQNQETQRGHYLRGLAVDCYQHPNSDRNSHYFGRELMFTGRYRSAIQELKRHVGMRAWLQERAQSLIFIGDCYGYLNSQTKENLQLKQIDYYHQAFHLDSSRREALIKLARYYEFKDWQAAACYAAAAMEITWNGFYGNDMSHYTNLPHEILYRAKGWTGDIAGARKHMGKALAYQPLNSMYLRDYRYYFDLPEVCIIIPHIDGTREEGLERVLKSIENLNYPQDKISTHVVPGDETVPQKVNEAANLVEYKWLVYGADDIEFTPDSLILAVMQGVDLVAFNTGELLPDAGNICEHFLINKEAFRDEDGTIEIFSEEFNHVGVDNWLWQKTERKMRLQQAVVHHYHFSRGGQMDDVYARGWDSEKVAQDRETLAAKLESLKGEVKEKGKVIQI
jgi:glycosyltransferase involved in cell wall biosynthesis